MVWTNQDKTGRILAGKFDSGKFDSSKFDAITNSDSIVWTNQAKNISTWANQDKSI